MKWWPSRRRHKLAPVCGYAVLYTADKEELGRIPLQPPVVRLEGDRFVGRILVAREGQVERAGVYDHAMVEAPYTTVKIQTQAVGTYLDIGDYLTIHDGLRITIDITSCEVIIYEG